MQQIKLLASQATFGLETFETCHYNGYDATYNSHKTKIQPAEIQT